ncbi:MAG: thiamine-phosphate kinase [Proteobacteria bacterium]|nr:MAG: thiamine-phosphate kinase [Pseudomonadota bacterium]
MSLGEFQLIDRYFKRDYTKRDDVVLGIGDDAAVVRLPAGQELAVAIDTLVAGVHFPRDIAPRDIGHKALAVNLSDLAAMGAEPAWATLALTLPEPDEQWVHAFASGFFALADSTGVALIGGDTTRGPMTISVQVAGHVPQGSALRRHGARPGDQVWVTGTLGDAALALAGLQGRAEVAVTDRSTLGARLDRPIPRIAEGCALRGLAHAAIDISDGLGADLGHLLDASGVGATIHATRLPLSAAMERHLGTSGNWALPLGGGDDYELCFTAPESARGAIEARFARLGTRCTAIGRIDERPGLRCIIADGEIIDPRTLGYQHFTGAGE